MGDCRTYPKTFLFAWIRIMSVALCIWRYRETLNRVIVNYGVAAVDELTFREALLVRCIIDLLRLLIDSAEASRCLYTI